jgi:predicted dithiol-disulfide oxidoreductase (DUF899 family)
MTTHKIVSKEQWLESRRALLEQEKQLTRQHDELARKRRELPWVRVEKNYVFDSLSGKKSLADLFGNHSQLLIYHFMFGPEWKEGCPSCSYVADHLNPTLPHLAARDVSLMIVSHAPLAKIEAFKNRMGWQFPWVSSFNSDFNYNFHVSFLPEHKKDGLVDYNYKMQKFPSDEAPGESVFFKEPSTGEVFHTYSTYGRGLDALLGTYTLLDMVPKGRDEDQLEFDMQWVRYHDRYDGGGFADVNKPYWPKMASMPQAPASSSCCGSKAGAQS